MVKYRVTFMSVVENVQYVGQLEVVNLCSLYVRCSRNLNCTGNPFGLLIVCSKSYVWCYKYRCKINLKLKFREHNRSIKTSNLQPPVSQCTAYAQPPTSVQCCARQDETMTPACKSALLNWPECFYIQGQLCGQWSLLFV